MKSGTEEVAPPDRVWYTGSPSTWKFRPNHSREQLTSLRSTIKDTRVSLVLTDKTNRVCAMPPDLLSTQLNNHFNDGWRELDHDPSPQLEKKANKLLLDCLSHIGVSMSSNSYLCNRLKTRYTWAPPAYPLAKDHKEGFPHTKVRIVQPVRGSAIEHLDVLCGIVLNQLKPSLTYRVESTNDFIASRLHSLPSPEPTDHLYQVSLDMVSMYPTLPTGDRALGVIRDYLATHSVDTLGLPVEDIISMLSFVFRHTYARTGTGRDTRYYHALKGVGTGYHSSAPFAEIIADFTYKQALASLEPQHHPLSLALYVDDSHSTWWGPDAHGPLLTALNNVWPGELAFTVEQCQEGQLSFLDLWIDLRGPTVEYEMYQKPTHSGQYLHFYSHCPTQTKLNIVSTEAKRILDLCSNMERAWPHLENLRRNMVSSGYPLDKVSIIIARVVHKHLHPRLVHTARNRDPRFMLKVPFTNDCALRLMRSAVARSGLSIRVVPTSGTKISSIIKREHCQRSPTRERCYSPQCVFHDRDMDCQKTHVVYEGTCIHCGDK